TMKYNPKINEDVAALPGFASLHPSQPPETAQGALTVLWELQQMLAAITGMDAATLAPQAGAQGEFAGMLMIKAFLADRDGGGTEGAAPDRRGLGKEHQPSGRTHDGEGRGRPGSPIQNERTRVLIPDSAHGTNPATAAMCGFEVVTIPTAADGNMDLDALARELDQRTAALMLTLPTTLGLWERNILRIATMVHDAGALLYGDGANLNAIAGQIKPGDLGFDAWHINTHKTFSTPHGGGGPGAGPVTVKEHLAPYLPDPQAVRGEDALIRLLRPEQSVGRLGQFHGDFGVLLRAYTYLRTLGADGIREMSEAAVVHANYLEARLRDAYRLPYDRRVMHEAVFSASRQKAASGVRALDIAKRLIDYGFHPPTIYFPLIVEEALMIEPTEAESRASIDAFCEAMISIAHEAQEQPDLVKNAPTTAPLTRLDEATAARKPVLRWRPSRLRVEKP
ncbi:MAG: aminomethyl-transferring glycine dehydrogenase subunit GcvPB, partial [Dehalococcoidia bacterium]